MRLYETHTAPNPRRVRMFLAEKGLLDQVELIEIDIKGGDNLSAEFAARNPMKKVPVLELDDGRCLGESMAICRYIEEAWPERSRLLGHDAWEKALIEQWLRWLDFHFMMPTGGCFQHGSGYFSDRMTPIADWAEVCRHQVVNFIEFLDQHLASHHWICGDAFCTADISAFVTLEFNRVNKIRPLESQGNLLAWYERMRERPSAAA